MDQATDLEAFVDAPIGKYMAGGSWIYFYPNASVSGFILWGRLNEIDLQQSARISPRVHAFAATPHLSLIDARRIERIDTAAFAVAATYLRENRPRISEAITKIAMVHAAGLFGAVAAGFFEMVTPPCPVKVFSDPLEACRWLGIEDGPELLAELDAIQMKVAAATPLLRDLGALLHARRHEVTLGDAARALGLSERSLQRRLSEHGTSFQKEMASARVRSAQTLLIDSDASITEIAFAVGCSSLHHFSELFRKITGDTPSDWRARHRAGARSCGP